MVLRAKPNLFNVLSCISHMLEIHALLSRFFCVLFSLCAHGEALNSKDNYPKVRFPLPHWGLPQHTQSILYWLLAKQAPITLQSLESLHVHLICHWQPSTASTTLSCSLKNNLPKIVLNWKPLIVNWVNNNVRLSDKTKRRNSCFATEKLWQRLHL